MSTNPILRIATQVDVGPLQAGMTEASSVVQNSTSKMAASFLQVKNAESQLTDIQKLYVQGVLSSATAEKELATSLEARLRAQLAFKAAQSEATAALQQVTTAETAEVASANEAAAAEENHGRSLMQMRYAAMLAARDLGLGLPRALSSIAAQSEALQPILSALFPIVAAIAFAEIIAKIPHLIIEATDALGGWNKEAQKAYGEQIQENARIVTENLRLREGLRDTGTIGEQGIGKVHAQMRVLNQNTQDASATLAGYLRQIQSIQKQIDEMSFHTSDLWTKSGKDIYENSRQVDQLRQSLAAYQKQADALRDQLQFRTPIEHARVGTEGKTESAADARRNFEAVAEAEKTVGEARVAYGRTLSEELYTQGKITLDQYTAALTDAENQRYQIQLTNFEKRKALAVREQAETGKSSAPEVAKISGEAQAAELAHEQKLAEIDNQNALTKKRNADEVALARIEAEKRVSEAAIALEVATAKAQVTTKKAGLQDETALLENEENKRYEAERKALTQRLALAKEEPEKNKALIITLESDLAALESTHQAKLTEIAAAGEKARIQDVMKAEEEKLRFVEQSSNRQLSATLKSEDEKLRTHQESLSKWEADEFAALNRWYAEQQTAMNHYLVAVQQTYGKDSQEYQNLLDKKAQLDQQYAVKQQQILDQVYVKYDQTYRRITQSINQSLISAAMMQQTWGQAAMRIYEQVASMAIQYFLQIAENWIEKHVLMAAINAIFHTQTQAQDAVAMAAHLATKSAANLTEATGDAGLAAAGQFAWYSAVNPPIAGAMAAAAFGEGMALASLAAFEQGGIVPNTGIALVHQGEGIVQKQFTEKIMQMTSGGGHTVNMGGITVNHNGTGKMSVEEISQAVRQGVRQGLIG